MLFHPNFTHFSSFLRDFCPIFLVCNLILQVRPILFPLLKSTHTHTHTHTHTYIYLFIFTNFVSPLARTAEQCGVLSVNVMFLKPDLELIELLSTT